MNIAWFFGILIIVMGEASVIGSGNNKNEIGQRTLLRKLQNFQKAPRDDTKSVTWNEILADVLVKKIKILSFASSEESLKVEKSEGNLLKESISQMLAIYKVFYDKYTSYNAVESKTIDDPKNEVELIKSKIDREPCPACVDAEASRTVGNPCLKDQVKNEQGNCVDEKPVKLILAIPNQCPVGYRADRLGYCRMVF